MMAGMATEKTDQPEFDPHHFVKHVTGKGMPEAQAEGLADAMTGMINYEFDPHHFAKDMTERGMPEGQIEVIAAAIVHVISANLAVKQSMEKIRRETDEEAR